MGLDMYFNLLKCEKMSYPEDLAKFNSRFAGTASVLYTVGYFRKFNALHSYIVEKFNECIDDCKPVYLTIKDVENILYTLSAIIVDHDKAEELMPTQSGCFFGSLDYDDYYFDDVERAYALFLNIKDTLKENSYTLVYEASW